MYKTGKKAKKEKAHTSTLRFVLLVSWLDFSCSVGVKSFGLAGLAGLADHLVWLIDFFNRPQTRLKRLKTHLCDYVT